jgi:hypothetical protein
MVSQTEVDPLMRALAAEPRRRAVACLRTHGTLTLADLTEVLVETCGQTHLRAVPAETVKRRYMELYHHHVPRLAAAGVVVYDQEDDLVRLTDDAVAIEPTVQRALDQLVE